MQGPLQQIVAQGPLILWLVWIGGIVVFTFLTLPKQRSYMERFPFWDRSTAMWRRQDDPELEQLRRTVWRLYGYATLWGFGYLLLYNGVIKLLDVTGVLHFR